MTVPGAGSPERPGGDPPGSGADEARVRAVIVGVVDAALRERGAGGIVLTGPDGPERRLLLRWLGDRATVPDAEAVRRCREALAGALAGTPPATLEAEARRAVAGALAAGGTLLLASEVHKTALVLGSGLPPEPLLPLGDLWASEVRELIGSCTPPPALKGVGPETLAAVDRALRRHLEEGWGREEALTPLDPELRDRLAALLTRRPWGRFRTPLVPKLGRRTVGIDLE